MLLTKRFVAMSICAVVVAALCAPNAFAAVTSYFGGPDASKLDMTQSNVARNSFLATLGGYGVENLESLGGQRSPTLTFGATGITAATGFPEGVQTFALYATSGQCFIYDSGATATFADWLEFSEPITAFGSYVVQGGDGLSTPPTSAPPNRLTFRLENTLLGTSKDVVIQDYGPNWPFYNVTFVGVTDTDPFNRISLMESYDYDGLLWDDLIAGNLPAPGDLNRDGTVDDDDLSIWTADYCNSGPSLTGDANGDGVVDGADFLVWQQNFTSPASEAHAAIPEPSTGLILAAALLPCVALRAAKHRNPA